ncbi:MAG: sodium:solute symporter [Flavobacteriaceae bacterium]|jgi:SSS family solute:Na+ symporter|nr:sodium:solute symporter [Flavobacteriaceae bacterium]
MSNYFLLSILVGYFIVLMVIARMTRGKQDNHTFFIANRSAPWYLVAFGMIGASLSGVTFISVPGWVEAAEFSYFQMVLGYIVGYFVIGTVLLPIYYRYNLTSIYTYLSTRFGEKTYKTGASFFVLSRIVGASFRLYLVASVLQWIIFDQMGVPFWVTVIATICFIWLYTHKSGIKTIVWTDVLQTLFMLIALAMAVYYITDSMQISNLISWIAQQEGTQIFFFDDYKSPYFFWKQFLSGALIAIVMTGLDQDMMQKNLACRSLKDAQKNVFWFTIILTVVNFVFLTLGTLLTAYALANGIDAQGDKLFPIIATQSDLGIGLSVVFLLGLIAAAYSSADSALTSLTTSISLDLLDIEKRLKSHEQERARKQVHLFVSGILILVILAFNYLISDKSVIAKLFEFAGYTYGPLLGLYTLGICTKLQLKDRWVPWIAVTSPVFGYFISQWALSAYQFDFGFFILALNGLLCFAGLVMISSKKKLDPFD